MLGVIMKIRIFRDTETLRYSAEELKKYAQMMMPSLTVDVTVGGFSEDAVNIGLLSDLGLSDEGVKDAMLDDLIDVNINGLSGYIAGSNERSCLMGVYNFFKSCGCSWVRPGNDGEYVPKKDISSHSFKFRKLADFPFRGECSDGATSFEHMRDTVIWLPKVNMNLFMVQHYYPYHQMNRWHRHLENTRLPHEDMPYEKCVEEIECLKKIIKKCGLQLHAVGHDILNEAVGIRYLKPGDPYDISEETKKAFALVDGKRELFGKSPVFTQLCMSQEWVQNLVVDWIVDYLKEHPEIDLLHFWLADASDNQCECEDCQKKHPSDWYVIILNKLDEKLTAEKIDSKIVFIMYVDTLWPPIEEKIKNPSRFIMTTACGPIINNPFEPAYEGGLPEWTRNKFSIPAGGLPMIKTFSDAWMGVFDGPRFIFDYVFFTPHYADLGYMKLTRTIAANTKKLKATGFDGIMSCQTHRCYFPTGLPVTLFGEFLFDYSRDTENFIDDYMKASFGPDYKLATEYLEAVSNAFNLEISFKDSDVTFLDDSEDKKVYEKIKGIIGNEKAGDVIATVPEIVDGFAPVVERNLALDDKCQKESWRILLYHGEYCKRMTKIYFALSRRDTDGATKYFNEILDYISEIEPEMHPYLDLVIFKRRMKKVLNGTNI